MVTSTVAKRTVNHLNLGTVAVLINSGGPMTPRLQFFIHVQRHTGSSHVFPGFNGVYSDRQYKCTCWGQCLYFQGRE